jgi:hypothetical protein
VAVVAASLIGLVALAAVAALRPPGAVVATAAVLLVPAAIAAVCAAAVRGRPDFATRVTPQDQLGGGAFMTLFHMAGPPTIAILGLVPVLVARDAAAAGHDPLVVAITGGLVVAFLAPLAPLAMRAMSVFTVDE